jgi:GH43 family beta-xylosidase
MPNPLLYVSTPDPAPLLTGSELLVISSGGNAGRAFPIHRYERSDGTWAFAGWAMRRANWWTPRTRDDDAPEKQRLAHVGPSAWPGHARAWTEDDFWAPELHRIRGRLLLFYSARRSDATRHGTLCIGVAVSKSGEAVGPFTDALGGEPLLCRPDGAIDPHVFLHGRGERKEPYLVWKDDANARGRRTTIFLQRLRADGLGLVGEPRPLLTNEPDSWEGGLVEAPWLVLQLVESGRYAV